MAFNSTIIRPAIGETLEIHELEDRVAALEEGVTPVVQALLDSKPDSATIDTITVLTQAAYDLLTPDSRTLYVVVD